MTASQDFYAILGVSRSFTPAELKKVYRRLAKQHHPDRNPGNKAAEEKFKQLSNAYHVLSDPARRTEYDLFLQKKSAPRETGSSYKEEDFVFDFSEAPVFDDLQKWHWKAFVVLGLVLYVICVLYGGMVAKLSFKAYFVIIPAIALFALVYNEEMQDFVDKLTLEKLNLLALVILAFIFMLHSRPFSYYSELKLPFFVGWLAWKSKWSAALLVAFALTALLFFRKRTHAWVLLFTLQVLLMTLVRFDHKTVAEFDKFMRQQLSVQKADMEAEEEPAPIKKDGGKSSVGGK